MLNDRPATPRLVPQDPDDGADIPDLVSITEDEVDKKDRDAEKTWTAPIAQDRAPSEGDSSKENGASPDVPAASTSRPDVIMERTSEDWITTEPADSAPPSPPQPPSPELDRMVLCAPELPPRSLVFIVFHCVSPSPSCTTRLH